MFGPKIKLSQAVYDKLRVAAQIIGCASIEEFAEKILLSESERIIASTGNSNVSDQEVEDITNKLKGLGYLE